MTIPADLSPHLHTEECNFLVRLWQDCRIEKSLFRQIILQECDKWYQAAGACFKQERLYRRETNKQKRRLLENNRLPEERYTRTLNKLKEEGKLNFNKPADKTGCCSV